MGENHGRHGEYNIEGDYEFSAMMEVKWSLNSYGILEIEKKIKEINQGWDFMMNGSTTTRKAPLLVY